MNKYKFMALAFFYVIVMIRNRGIDATNAWLDKDIAHTQYQKAFFKELGHDVGSKGAGRIRRKYTLARLKEASVKKS